MPKPEGHETIDDRLPSTSDVPELMCRCVGGNGPVTNLFGLSVKSASVSLLLVALTVTGCSVITPGNRSSASRKHVSALQLYQAALKRLERVPRVRVTDPYYQAAYRYLGDTWRLQYIAPDRLREVDEYGVGPSGSRKSEVSGWVQVGGIRCAVPALLPPDRICYQSALPNFVKDIDERLPASFYQLPSTSFTSSTVVVRSHGHTRRVVQIRVTIHGDLCQPRASMCGAPGRPLPIYDYLGLFTLDATTNLPQSFASIARLHGRLFERRNMVFDYGRDFSVTLPTSARRS